MDAYTSCGPDKFPLQLTVNALLALSYTTSHCKTTKVLLKLLFQSDVTTTDILIHTSPQIFTEILNQIYVTNHFYQLQWV